MIWTLHLAAVSLAAQPQMPVATYARAERILAKNVDALVLRDKISPPAGRSRPGAAPPH